LRLQGGKRERYEIKKEKLKNNLKKSIKLQKNA